MSDSSGNSRSDVVPALTEEVRSRPILENGFDEDVLYRAELERAPSTTVTYFFALS